MKIPVNFQIFDITIAIHQITEVLAYFLGFQLYRWMKKRQPQDSYTTWQRVQLVIAAAGGAMFGSFVIGTLDQPAIIIPTANGIQIAIGKTIVGGLIGGWISIEIIKKYLGYTKSSGDLFTFPIIFGMGIGRIGCWLQGIEDGTYGIETTFFMGMNLGDGLLRHPTALYEIFFLSTFGLLLHRLKHRLPDGGVFLTFMMGYMSWRVGIDFIKPGSPLGPLGLTLIQLSALLAAVAAGLRLHMIYRKARHAHS